MLEQDNIQLTNAHLVTEALLIPEQRIEPSGPALLKSQCRVRGGSERCELVHRRAGSN
jgi:hypothetical protein